MKKSIISRLLNLVWVPLLVISCSPMEQPMIIPQTGASLVSAPSTLDLKEEDAEEFIVFNVSPADFGVNTDITYTLQMDKPGSNFASPANLGSSSSTSIEVLISDINTNAIAKGVESGESGPMEFRVRAVPNRSLSPIFGEVTTITVDTYKKALPFRNLFLVGNATAAGWNNNNNNTPLFRDPQEPNKFSYTGYFEAGEFKLLERLNQWQPQYGTNGGNAVAVNPGGGNDPGSFVVATAGYYTFSVNIEANTFTLEPFSGNTAQPHTTIGIIGSATQGGWDASTAMNNTNFDRHIWSITATLVNGEMKFRANNAWTVNWGANTPMSGKSVQDGPNIPVDAGSYKVWFNSLDGRYLLILQ
jgi:starch-binding outer membrane protein SusE/F